MWNALTWTCVACIVMLSLLFVGVRLIGYTPYSVLSPSMSPAYKTGDLVYVRSVDPEDIDVDDVITFVADENLTVVTHRVYDIDQEHRRFITKGDANEDVDAGAVMYENVVGVVGFSIPKLGYFAGYLTSDTGRYVGFSIVCALLLIAILPDLFRRDNESDIDTDVVS